MSRDATPSTIAVVVPASGPVWAAQLFLVSLLIPFNLSVGELLLMPHRIVLLVLFVPFFLRLFVLRRAGPVLAADWLMFGSALWAGPSLVANHSFGAAVQPFGIHMLEFFGAYLLARVSIRNGTDFRRMVRTFFVLLLVIVPFAVVESVTHRPVLLDLLPGTSFGPTNAGVRMGLRRAQAVFAHPILFGVFVSTALGFFWYALKPRRLGAIGAPLVMIGTIVSLSTGALISFSAQAVFIGWETVVKALRARWRLFLGLVVAAYVTIDLLSNRTPFHVLVTYASFNSNSAYNRIRIWEFGTDSVWANPVFGLGLNEWERPTWMSSSVDNFWLLIAMRYGLPASVMVMTALFLILRRVSRAELDDPSDRLARAGFLVSFGGLVVAGGTVHYWHSMMAFALFVIGSGLWAATGGGASAAPAGPAEPRVPRRSRYTRQLATGGRIGQTVGQPPGTVSRAVRRRR